MRVALLAAATLVALPPIAAAVPDPLTTDRLDRGALLALPAVYRLDAVLDVPALRLDDGSTIAIAPAARRVRVTGAAVGVAPGGLAVTAGHLVGGGDAAAAVAYRTDRALAGRPVGVFEARRWVEQNEVEPVGVRLVRLAASPAVQPVEGTRTLTAEAVAVDATADLALLRISAGAAGPSVPLDDAQTIGTPVVTIGYGGEAGPRPADEPALRRGALGRTGFVPREEPAEEGGTTIVEETATEVLGGILRGDSGGPVVDASGRLRGIVVSLGRTDGILEPSGAIRRFLREHGVTPRVGLADTVFRSGMEDLWALDFAGAEQAFGRTSRLAPDHPSTPALLARTLELKEATVRLRSRHAPRHFLHALAMTAAVGAIVSALALLSRARREPARPRPEQPAPEGGAP